MAGVPSDAIKPSPGSSFTFEFEDWKLDVENGTLLSIPTEDKLDQRRDARVIYALKHLLIAP